MQKLESRRQVIDMLEFDLGTARGKIDNLAFDRLFVRTEQKSRAPWDQPLRRAPEPTSFIGPAHAQLCDKPCKFI